LILERKAWQHRTRKREPDPRTASNPTTQRDPRRGWFATNFRHNNNNGKLAKAIQSQEKPKLSGPKLVRYNGPDVEDTTDFDGMEKASVKKKRNRVLDLKKANLVRYQGFSQQKRLEETAEPEETRNQQRKTLAEDVGYANRYTGLTDYSLAKKTGLAVNKPISLWVERDKFL